MDPVLRAQAQQLDSRLGKLLRLNTDGSAAPGNPFEEGRGCAARHLDVRSPQFTGTRVSPGDARALVDPNMVRLVAMSSASSCPAAITAGQLMAYGTENDRSPINGGLTQAPNMEQPKYFWDPAIGPTSMTRSTPASSSRVARQPVHRRAWGSTSCRLVLNGDRVVGEERLLLDQRRE